MTYAATCREWGIDPAAEIEDPFLAHQLRIGLLHVLRSAEEEAEKQRQAQENTENLPTQHADRIAQARTRLQGHV